MTILKFLGAFSVSLVGSCYLIYCSDRMKFNPSISTVLQFIGSIAILAMCIRVAVWFEE